MKSLKNIIFKLLYILCRYIFKTDIIEKLIRSNKKISTLIDTDWLKKWKKKKNYLEDLEELKN
jgi:hypothetical protein